MEKRSNRETEKERMRPFVRMRVNVDGKQGPAGEKSNLVAWIRGFRGPCRLHEIERGVSKCHDFRISVEN